MSHNKALPNDIDRFFAGKSIFFEDMLPVNAQAATPPLNVPSTPDQPSVTGAPTNEPTKLRTDERPNDRMTTQQPALPAQTAQPSVETPVETRTERSNERTVERTKVRHTFDIFQDQLTALRRIQLAREELSHKHYRLGDLVQEALDAFINQERKND